MPRMRTTKIEVQTNHRVIFRCRRHNYDLEGSPTWYQEIQGSVATGVSRPFWMIDTSEMWCPEAAMTPDHTNDEECQDAWYVEVEH